MCSCCAIVCVSGGKGESKRLSTGFESFRNCRIPDKLKNFQFEGLPEDLGEGGVSFLAKHDM